MMPVRPPLVAVANPGGNTDPWAGMWIAEDIQTILAVIKSGSWIDTTLGAVSAGLDALAFVSDPIGSLLQYGVAWILEHVKPLSEALVAPCEPLGHGRRQSDAEPSDQLAERMGRLRRRSAVGS